MKVCSVCSNRCEDLCDFCPMCGSPLPMQKTSPFPADDSFKNIPTPPQNKPFSVGTPNTYGSPIPPFKKKKVLNKGLLFAIIGIVLVVCLAVGGFVIFKNKGAFSKDNAPTVSSKAVVDTPTDDKEQMYVSDTVKAEEKQDVTKDKMLGYIPFTSEALGFSLRLPLDWSGKYIVNEATDSVMFYNSSNYNADFGGRLFTISATSQDMFPGAGNMSVLGVYDGRYYIAHFPTDIQHAERDSQLINEYQQMNASTPAVISSFEKSNKYTGATGGISQAVEILTNGSSAQLTLYSWNGTAWDSRFSCTGTCGKNGISTAKREGDGCTPGGIFDICFAFGVNRPSTALDFKQITANSVWVTDTNSSYYNTLQNNNSSNRDWSSATDMYSLCKSTIAGGIAFSFNGDCSTGCFDNIGGSEIWLDGRKSQRTTTPGDIDIKTSDYSSLLSLLNSSQKPIIDIHIASSGSNYR